MKTLKFLIALLALVVPGVLVAQDLEVDFTNADSIITWLMPVLTLAATWAVKRISPFITGTVTLIVVPVVSAIIAWLGTVIDGDTSFIVSLLAGLGAVFLNQLYRSLTEK